MTTQNQDDRALALWDEAQKSHSNEQRLALYNEAIALVPEDSATLSVAVFLWKRGSVFRDMRKYDEALGDFRKAVDIAERRQETAHKVNDWRRVISDVEAEQRRLQIEASGGDKAAKFSAMTAEEKALWVRGPEFDKALLKFIQYLQDQDADVRVEARRMLLQTSSIVLEKLRDMYQVSGHDRRLASLVGRVLGANLTGGGQSSVSAFAGKLTYGFPICFIECVCAHCGASNKGIPAPPNGDSVPYYAQKDDNGAFVVPVICDKCGREFFVAWDESPQ